MIRARLAFIFSGLLVLCEGVKHFLQKDALTLSTNNVQLVFDTKLGDIQSISADFNGQSQFIQSSISAPFGLSGASQLSPPQVEYSIAQPDSDTSILSVSSVNKLSGIEEQWKITMNDKSRAIRIQITGKTTKDMSSTALAYNFKLPSSSLYGLFSSGVTQMMDKSASCLGSQESLQRAYFLGEGSAFDIIVNDFSASTVIFHSDATNTIKSGLDFVVAGAEYPNIKKDLSRAWDVTCWGNTSAVTIPSSTTWSLDLTLIPNNFDFPVYLVQDVSVTNTMKFDDIQSYLTGIYPSAVGCLQSYFSNQQGIIAPTISHPDVGYDPDTNFFDPDNFITLSALLYSGDDYLVEQTRQVLERTAQTMCGLGTNQDKVYCNQVRQRIANAAYESRHFTAKNLELSTNLYAKNERSGQLMHHFISLDPTYESIAGSEQLGPNIFWTLATIKFAALTQNLSFAQEMFPFVDLSTKFILSFIDTSNYLVNAPGPLWIDVLVRENYTSDSSSMLVPTLTEIAQFYDYLGEDPDFAEELRMVSNNMSVAINQLLWAESQDHLVTQLNLDGTTRDFVDYDSNLIAVASNIIPDDKVQAVLTRVDSGEYTHIRATWCSEIPYTGDADDCYIVGGDYCGDSIVTLARIGWMDALARKRVGDVDTLYTKILQPLQQDLAKDTWLYERYDSTGTQIRTAYYFEYPALVTMILREVVYGIVITVNSVEIKPMFKDKSETSFTYAFGNIQVDYSMEEVRISLPGEASQAKEKNVAIGYLLPNRDYNIVIEDKDMKSNKAVKVNTDKDGTLTFSATFFSHRIVVVSATRK